MTDLLHFDSLGCHIFWLFFLFAGAGHQRLLPWCMQRSKSTWYSSYQTWQGLGDCGKVVCEGNWWVRRTRTLTTTLMTVPLISCQPLRLHSPRRFTWWAWRSREGKSKFQVERVRPSCSWRQLILSGNGVVVSRSSHGFLFWPGVCWRFLTHPPHLSAYFLPLVTPWPRNNAVCHVIILRNACIYMRPGLKSVSGPQTRRSSTWTSSSWWHFFPLWPLVSEEAFYYKVTFIWCGINVFSWTWNDRKRIWVGTHILCLCVCRVRLLTWFLSLNNNVDNQFWLVSSTTLQYPNFYHSVISIFDVDDRV